MLFNNLIPSLITITLLVLLLIVSVVIVIVLARRKEMKQELQEAVYKSKINSITLAALRSQMNPHFIFNCLNSIKLYTEQNDSVAASEYLGKFSKLIRNMLDSARAENTSLSSEIDTLRLYLEMETMRFKEKLHYNLLVDKDIDADFIEIPPLLIQPYVENAIWHGIMHRPEGGNLTVTISQTEEMLYITVQDDGIGRSNSQALKNHTSLSHKSHGTQITSDRIALLNEHCKYPASVVITDLTDDTNNPIGTLVTIQLPIK